jgi:hypothetical protein
MHQIAAIFLEFHIHGGHMRFHTRVLSTGKNTTGIGMPEDVLTELGGGRRPAITVSINDHTYRTTVGSLEGRPMLSASSDIRQAAGVAAGDDVEVTVELDSSPREIEVPQEQAAALADDAARNAFSGLSNSKKQQLTLPISKEKTDQTRMRNVEKALTKLRGE